jgi:hypothetical protein
MWYQNAYPEDAIDSENFLVISAKSSGSLPWKKSLISVGAPS